MEALYPGCTTRISKTKQTPDVTGKVLDQTYNTRQNVYSSTPTTDTVSPILLQQNSTLHCVSSHNPRCATMPSRTRLSPRHPQAPSVDSQQFSGYTDMPSHTNISSIQHRSQTFSGQTQLSRYAATSSHTNISSPLDLQTPSPYPPQLPGYADMPSYTNISIPQHPSQTHSGHLQLPGYADMPSYANISIPQNLPQTYSGHPQLPGYAPMPSHTNVSTQYHLQTPSAYPQQLHGHNAMLSHQSISTLQHSQTSPLHLQHSQTSPIHLQQKPNTSWSPQSDSLPLSSINTSSFQGQIITGKSQIEYKAL